MLWFGRWVRSSETRPRIPLWFFWRVVDNWRIVGLVRWSWVRIWWWIVRIVVVLVFRFIYFGILGDIVGVVVWGIPPYTDIFNSFL